MTKQEIISTIKELRGNKKNECETCACHRHDWCSGYEKALKNLEIKLKLF